MSACVACGAEFQCGMVDTDTPEPCWCTRLPPLPAEQLKAAALSGKAGCYCPDCLRAMVSGTAEGLATAAGQASTRGQS